MPAFCFGVQACLYGFGPGIMLQDKHSQNKIKGNIIYKRGLIWGMVTRNWILLAVI